MDTFELIKLAIEALKANLVRTVLTMLGVIIGIASVIIIMSLGEGATASIVNQISSFGANILTVYAGSFSRKPGGGGTADSLTDKDISALSKIPDVINVAGVVTTSKQVTYDNVSAQVSITGVESVYTDMHDLTIDQGSFISDVQANSRSKVVVMGDDLVEDIFGENAQVVGESVRIDGKAFRVIGVVVDSEDAYVPISTVQKILLSQDYYNSIEVEASDSELVESIDPQMETVLLSLHDIDNPDNADFKIFSSQEMASTISDVTGTLTALLSGIAAISLVVGGIGIMNIMLVTVTERTREIGLLKAIGAKKQDILTQFLIEAVVVTIAGGMIGISIGLGITYIATLALSIPFILSLKSVALALSVSAGVGIVFGFYPARQAANLQPIDALRYE